jgi:hypothetical protein
MEHAFTATIKAVLQKNFGSQAGELFERSLLLQYLNIKTRAANRGSKSRSSFANLYALYVLAEDYLKGGFDKAGDYSKYDGAVFSRLFERQCPFLFGRVARNDWVWRSPRQGRQTQRSSLSRGAAVAPHPSAT